MCACVCACVCDGRVLAIDVHRGHLCSKVCGRCKQAIDRREPMLSHARDERRERRGRGIIAT